MEVVGIWSLVGRDAQNAVVRSALARSSFPWDRLKPGLRRAVGREIIPVEWSDLSRYAPARAAGGHGGHVEDHHVEEDGDQGHVLIAEVDGRRAPLGLAWYSGRITLEQSMDTVLATEVFLAEAAHMVDFFYMTPEMRDAVFLAFHPGQTKAEAFGHGHGWFEETGNNDYWSWVGEGFMGGFTAAFSDLRPSIGGFVHAVDAAGADRIRRVLLGDIRPVFGSARSLVFHDAHAGIRQDLSWPTAADAAAAGRKPCRICKPS